MSRRDLTLNHRNPSSPAHRTTGPAFLAAVCLSLVLATPGLAAVCDSLASGNFNFAGNWSCGTVPSAIDDATVKTGHFMTSTANVTVQSLIVEGGAALEMQGFSLTVQTPTLEVQAGGSLQGASGANGSTVYVTAPMGASMTVRNYGVIRGGSPGGSVFIHDGGQGGDLPCPTGSLIEAVGGIFMGGAGGTMGTPAPAGNVYLLAETVDLQSSFVVGGSGFVPFNFLGHSQAGNVYVAGINVVIDGGTFVTSGTNTNPATGAIGGTVKIVAQSCNANVGNLYIGPGSTVTVGAPSFGGCPGALVYAAGTSTILGTVAPGPAGCLYWDPPKLVLAGDAELTGGQVILAGSDFDATGLASRTLATPAIDAADTLEINLNPGGAADFQGLAPGFVYFRAGSSITIRADQVLLDPGVGLEDLMEPPPDVLRGAPTLLLDMTGNHQQFVSPGASVQYPVQVTNIGSASAYFKVTIEDSEGWLAGGAQFISQSLDPGEAILRTLTIDVPRKARSSRSTTVTLTASVEGKPPQKTQAVFIMND